MSERLRQPAIAPTQTARVKCYPGGVRALLVARRQLAQLEAYRDLVSASRLSLGLYRNHFRCSGARNGRCLRGRQKGYGHVPDFDLSNQLEPVAMGNPLARSTAELRHHSYKARRQKRREKDRDRLTVWARMDGREGFVMLRITTNTSRHALVLRLEGRLQGPWVAVLEQSFTGALSTRRGRRICLDLTGVTFVDTAGKVRLAQMYAQGAELMSDDIETKALVAEIRGERASDGDGEAKQMNRKTVVNEHERLTELQRLEAELHEANQDLVQAAQPLERLSEMSLEQRQKLADEIRSKLSRWDSVTQQIQQVMEARPANGENESESQ